MASDVSRAEFTELQEEVEGEKLVTRHILAQSRRNADDLAVIKSRLDRVEHRLDGVDQRLGGVEGTVGGLAQKLDTLTRNLPKIVGEVMREVLDERDRQR
jgi:archaellum component FlaC